MNAKSFLQLGHVAIKRLGRRIVHGYEVELKLPILETLADTKHASLSEIEP